ATGPLHPPMFGRAEHFPDELHHLGGLVCHQVRRDAGISVGLPLVAHHQLLSDRDPSLDFACMDDSLRLGIPPISAHHEDRAMAADPESEWPPEAIYTVGHSTRAIEEFIALLQQHGVQQL